MQTFDDWYKAKHGGFSFDAHHLLPDHDKGKAFMALTKELRDYATDMVGERLKKDE